MHEIVGDQQPSSEARRGLLKDARSTRDVYAQERARTENQLFAAKQVVTALSTQLRIADEKLTTIEDLIGEVRTRMHTRGLATHPSVSRPSHKSVTSAVVILPCEFTIFQINSKLKRITVSQTQES